MIGVIDIGPNLLDLMRLIVVAVAFVAWMYVIR
jgi:hypothetical protein